MEVTSCSVVSLSISCILRAISGIVHAHHFCGGKQGKLSGSRISTISKFASIQFIDKLTADGYFRIFWTNTVTYNVSEIFFDP